MQSIRIVIGSVMVLASGGIGLDANAGSVKELTVQSELALRVGKVTPPSGISLTMINTASSPVRLWRESNTWGVAHWRVIRIRAGQATLFYQVPTEGFTRNVPAFDELAGHVSVEIRLDLSGQAWRSTDRSERDVRVGDFLVVVYDVPVTDEAQQLGVWHGAVIGTMSAPQ